jgi:hypothetical protein
MLACLHPSDPHNSEQSPFCIRGKIVSLMAGRIGLLIEPGKCILE